MSNIVQDKPCCTVCDAKKLCSVCKRPTLMACSDCQIDFGVTIYVCAETKCRDAHERKCSYSRRPMEAALAQAARSLISYGQSYGGGGGLDEAYEIAKLLGYDGEAHDQYIDEWLAARAK